MAEVHTLTVSDLYAMLPRRKRDAQKGDFGRLLCLTGSRRMPGACYLSTMGALRSGAGLVTVATASENLNRLAAAMPEAMWLPLETDANGFLQDESNRAALLPLLQRADGVLMGCGMGMTDETKSLVHWILSQVEKKPIILDADGLNCIAGCINISKENWILTPHPGEMERLLGCTISEVQADRVATARRFASQSPSTLLLKGAGTLVAQSNWICCNPTGNPGMSRGGSGDVLAGMVAGLAVQGLSARDAACVGVYIHGLAGDLAAQQFSEQAMLPTDLLACVPQAFLQLEQLRDRNFVIN